MCLMQAQQQPDAEPGRASPAPLHDRARPRWIGAVGATFVAGLALAATLVTPSLNREDATLRATGVPATMGAGQEKVIPAAAVIEQTALPVDDGVPSSSVVKARGGDCHHGL